MMLTCRIASSLAAQLLLLLLLSILDATQAQQINWSCSANVEDFPLNITAAAGVWYEAARIPKAQVTECLNVTAPASPTEDDRYALELDYYLTVNGQWTPTHKTIDFPWNSKTQNGYFELIYNPGTSSQVTVVFRLIFTDYTNVALLCGYAGISPIPLFKLMTRQRVIDSSLIEIITKMADKYGIAGQIVWEEQAVDKCVGGAHGMRANAGLTSAFILLLMAIYAATSVLPQ